MRIPKYAGSSAGTGGRTSHHSSFANSKQLSPLQMWGLILGGLMLFVF